MTNTTASKLRRLSALLALSFAAISIPLQAADHCTDSPVDGAIYKITNAGSELLLNVANASTSNGANVNTVSNNGASAQRFYANYNSNSHYWTLEAAHTGMLVDIAGESVYNGGNAIQAVADSSNSQEWELKLQPDGSYRIVNRNSSHSLTVASASEGANVYQNSDAGVSSQRWWLDPVNVSCGSSSSNSSASTTTTTATGITLSGSAGNSKVALNWNTLSGITALQIYMDTDSNPSGRSRIAALSTSATSFTATGLSNGTSYWFWVKYRKADGSWGNSNAFSAKPSSGSSSVSGVTGFASMSGSDGLSTTTGGASGSTVTVTSCSALKNALASSSALTIQIPNNTTIDCNTSGTAVSACKLACPSYQDAGKYTYRIPTSSVSCSSLGAVGTATKYTYAQKLNVASNKTLVGLGSGSTIKGASLMVYGVKNVIIKNLNITDVNPHLIEAYDGVTIYNATHVVVDHVAFSMISDGHIDVNNGDNITLSNNHFYGYNNYVCANQHWYTNAVTDGGKITFSNNFWEYVGGRNPKLTGSTTRAHIYNNYWYEVSYFAIGVKDYAQALLQGNYFDDAARPHWNEGNGLINANISTNVYTGAAASGSYAIQDTGASVFGDTKLYNYTVGDVYSVPNLQNSTGPK